MSGCMSFGVMVIIFLVVTSGIPLPFRSRDRGRAWRRLARQFNGVFTGIGLLTSPMLRFRYGSARVTLSANRREVKFTISWPDPRVQCDVTSRTDSGQSRSAASRFPAVQIDDANFDWSFHIHSPDQDGARRLLSAHVRSDLERLAAMNGNRRVHVTFRPGQLTVVKHARMTLYEALLAFTRNCMSLYDQALLTRAEGIDFCDEDDFLPLDEVKCQVCGDEIGEDLVFCARCRTPHHHECWEYYGSCTVYGCQEQNYEWPKVAALLAPASDGGQDEELPDEERPDEERDETPTDDQADAGSTDGGADGGPDDRGLEKKTQPIDRDLLQDAISPGELGSDEDVADVPAQNEPNIELNEE